VATFQLKPHEQAAVDALRLSLDSLADMINLTLNSMGDGTISIPQVPEWVQLCSSRLKGTLFNPIAARLSESGFSPYRAGYSLGIMRWGVGSMQRPKHEFNVLAKKQKFSAATKRKMGKMFEDFFVQSGFLTRAEIRKSKFIPSEARRYESKATGLAPLEASEYHRGYADGLRGIGEGAPGDRSDLATNIHLILVIWWRFVVKFKSVTELHLWLSRHLGADKTGDKKRIEKICQRIHLKFREPGRPLKKPTLALPG
jgi:hypothetical protein